MASAYLYKDLGTPTNAYKGTVSHWVKRSGLGASTEFGSFAAWLNGGSSTRSHCNWYDDTIYFYSQQHSMVIQTNRKFRDVNAWYHTVIAWDTTQSTASDRVKIYINGVQETSFSTANYPAQNSVLEYNVSGRRFGVGCLAQSNGSAASFWDGCISDFIFVDGTALTPTSFGETDSTTGIWKPKTTPSVTYGTNGFFLKMNNSANMGLDSSGQSNNYTTSGTIIQTKDTPSNVFCNNNRLWKQESARYVNLSKVNGLISGAGSSTWYQLPGTLAFSKGKYYWECKFSAGTNLDKNTAGVIDFEKTQESGQFQDKAGSVFYKNEDGGETRIDGSTSSADYGTLAQNDILGVAVDMDAATPTVKFYKNGSLLVTASAASLAGKTVTPAQTVYTSGEYSVNYGNGYFGTTAVSSAENPDDGVGIFEHDVPAGYRALCTASINAQEYS